MTFGNHMRWLLCSSALAASAATSALAEPMPPEQSLAGLEYELISQDDLYIYGALDSYAEAPFLTKLVEAGKLPPVAERLPEEPIIMQTGAMVDGIGEYGGVFRHVIGGRPEGYNWMAGQHQGWGGINMAVQECLVRQGPRWQIKPDEQGPLPNLAQSWSWNDDNTELTLNLMKGVKWSDGNAFDAEDVRFWYEDNVQDENIGSRLAKDGFGGGAELTVVNDYTVSFKFAEPQGELVVESLAYIQGCPGPSHILKKKHPKYGGESYDAYASALPADGVPPVVLGAWVPVAYKPDELVVLRRNPYYFKVDETGQQLPYYNEMLFRLSTWGDRTAQAVAGTGDFSNMEDPGNYVEALKQSQSEDSPVKVNFGPRTLGWQLMLNYSLATAEDEYDRALRTLFRETDFRLGLSHALDRDAIGQAVARGPFAYPYMGGLVSGSPAYDADSTNFRPFDQEKAKALFDSVGAVDTDGNGIRNLPSGGEDITIVVVYPNNRNEQRKQLDAMTSQLAEVGIELRPRGIDETNFDAVRTSGAFTARFGREGIINPTRQTCRNLPVSLNCPHFHKASDGKKDFLDFEQDIADAYATYVSTSDVALQAQAMRDLQKAITDNAYVIGTIQVPAALLVNKRVKNAHPGTPVRLYEWAEDGVMRERLYTPSTDQIDEILPNVIPEYN